MTFQGVKGTVDYYPERKEIWNFIANACRKQALQYGFLEVESPAMETLGLLCEKEGEETKEQIFTLEKRSKEQLGLRFDLTVPLTRMFIQKSLELPKPVKWFAIGRMWRYEAPQRGRLREFYQFNIEIFGSREQEADAQIIGLAIDTLKALGLTSKDFFVRVSNRFLLEGLLQGIGIGNIDEILQIIDKMAKVSEEAFIEMLEQAGLTQEQIRKIDTFIKVKDISELGNLNELAAKGRDQLLSVLRLLGDKKEFIKVDLSIARGLAYYTGVVFEAYDCGMKYRALLGGGRYDNMVRNFGGEDTPATGFGLGFATVELLLDEKRLLPTTGLGLDYYLVTIGDEARTMMPKILSKLRDQGYRADADLMGRSLSKQMQHATKIGAKKVLILGDEELKSGYITEKTIGESRERGKQRKVKFSEIGV